MALSQTRVLQRALLTLLLAGGFPGISSALTIQLNYVGSGSPDAQAAQGFANAAAMWEGAFTDDVTVRVDWDFSTLGPGILGSTSSTKTNISYASTRSALIADAKSSADASATANLQAGPALEFISNGPNGSGYMDTSVRKYNTNTDLGGGDAYNTTLSVNTANAKALGLYGAHDTSAADASIAFSNTFSWDFDRSNGIDGSAFDFVGVAAHEIGHALGFVSGVDLVDYNALPGGPNTPVLYSLFEELGIGTPLDLFRYTADSVSQGVMDWAVGDAPGGDTPYFSVDGGATGIATFSTGVYNGDGRQASHWEDNLGLGLLDPTADYGELLMLTGNDLLAFDAIGWDLRVVPIPQTLLLLVAGLLGLRLRRH